MRFCLKKDLALVEGEENKMVAMPSKHIITVQPAGGQMLGVFSENSGDLLVSSARSLLGTPMPHVHTVISNYGETTLVLGFVYKKYKWMITFLWLCGQVGC